MPYPAQVASGPSDRLSFGGPMGYLGRVLLNNQFIEDGEEPLLDEWVQSGKGPSRRELPRAPTYYRPGVNSDGLPIPRMVEPQPGGWGTANWGGYKPVNWSEAFLK